MKKWFTGYRCRLLIYGAIVSAIALPAAGYYFEPFSGRFERYYRQIESGMTQDDISAILGAEPEKTKNVTFYFGAGKSDHRPVASWTYWSWGRPYVIFVAFDENNRAVWKRFRKGAVVKLGFWLFNDLDDTFGGPIPTNLSAAIIQKGRILAC